MSAVEDALKSPTEDLFSVRPSNPPPPLDPNPLSAQLRWFWAMFIQDHGKEYIRGVLRRAVEDIMQVLGDEGFIGTHDMELFKTAQDRRDSRELVTLFLEIVEHSDHNERFKNRLLELLEEHPATKSLIAPTALNEDLFSVQPSSPPPLLDAYTSSARLRWFWAMFIQDYGKEYISSVLRHATEDIMQALRGEGLISNHDMELFETAQDRRDSRELVRLFLEIAEHSDHNEKFKDRLLEFLKEHPATEGLMTPN
ncbi:hypothetical protein C8R46DRAFT_1219123 [Mycena filopes]|nr:hypothetical protein C8R46DRAFT_1219123 [Mycena filopes]